MNSDDPARNLGFLIHEVARLMRRNFDRRVSTLGLTQAQWRALAHLSRNEGINQATLADLMEVRPITLARLIDRLEEAGWVERRRDPADRRVCRLHLTEAAQPVLVEMESHAAATRQDLLAGMSAAEQRQVLETLCALKKNLLQAEESVANEREDDE
jgi:DNA-binding MarR family transcriptional regulator